MALWHIAPCLNDTSPAFDWVYDYERQETGKAAQRACAKDSIFHSLYVARAMLDWDHAGVYISAEEPLCSLEPQREALMAMSGDQ